MDPLITLRVVTIPVAQPRARSGARLVDGKAVSSTYSPRTIGEGDNKRPHPILLFKAAIQQAAARYAGKPLEGPLVLSLRFCLPRPGNKVWKTRPMPREPHIVKPDLDNLIKAVKDALKGLTWRDDCQVCRYGSVEKCLAAGDEQPHVMIWIGRAT